MPHCWENTAGVYVRSFAGLCAGTVDEILRRLGPGDPSRRLLDIGTGPGTVAAAARDSGYAVIGLDSDSSMIDLASRRHPGIGFGLASIERLPCRDQTFEAITANFVVNHAPDPRSAARELFRGLRSGGRLVATIWSSQPVSLHQLWNDVMAQAGVSPSSAPRLPAALDFERTPEGFGGMLAEAGFEQVDCRELRWTFEIRPDDLWAAVEAGIAGIGQTFRSQDAAGQERLRAAYRELTAVDRRAGVLKLPSIALVASADRVR